LGKVFIKDNFIMVPNNDLSPEYSYSSSLGWIQKFSLFNNRIKININNSSYLTYLKNVIVRKSFELNGNEQLYYNNNWYSAFANQNSGNALIYGYSSSLDIVILKKLLLHSGLTYTKGLLTEDNLPFGHISPLIGRFSLKVKEKKYEFSFSSLFNAHKKIVDFGPGNVDNPNEASPNGYPKWITLNSSIRYSINKHLKIKLGCYNILDIHYKTFASGISSPGRSYLVSVKLTY
jgi:hemoglobin/transferrin/lactoferrin receptor protein